MLWSEHLLLFSFLFFFADLKSRLNWVHNLCANYGTNNNDNTTTNNNNDNYNDDDDDNNNYYNNSFFADFK